MTEEENVQQIVEKYNKSLAELFTRATEKEFKTVMTYIANQANQRQRRLVGLSE